MGKTWNNFMSWHISRFNQNRASGMVTYDTLEFPIRWDRSIPLLEHLFYVFKYYVSELSVFGIEQNRLSEIKEVCNCVLNVYSLALHHKHETAIEKINTISKILPTLDIRITDSVDLYRLRPDKENLRGKDDFMHVPFNKLYLCNSMRFSMPGEPCLYLGYSKDVCYKELGKDKGGSIGHFNPKVELHIADLTLEQQEKDLDSLFDLWPILAACYVAPDDRNAKFKEEYIFPQILMQYIKEKGENVDGLRYYSCRCPELDPKSTGYMNLALFARKKEEENNLDINKDFPLLMDPYDKALKNKLDFIE